MYFSSTTTVGKCTNFSIYKSVFLRYDPDYSELLDDDDDDDELRLHDMCFNTS